MGIAAWLVWRRGSFQVTGKALAVFAFQLGLNLAWSFLFFGLQLIDLALVEIVILHFTIIINTIIFWRLNRLAGLSVRALRRVGRVRDGPQFINLADQLNLQIEGKLGNREVSVERTSDSNQADSS